MAIIGVVLAGGAGRRIGRAKGDLRVGGATLADRAARALWPLCGSVLVSLAPGAPNPAPAFATVEDRPPSGRGPLAGVAAAFEVTGNADLLVLACDYPRVDAAFLARVVEAGRPEDDLVMPTDPGGRDHPLVALWRRGAEPAVRAALVAKSYKVRALLSELRVRRLGPRELPDADLATVLTNLNTLQDLSSYGPLTDPE